MYNQKQRRGGLSAIVAKAWSYTPVRFVTYMAGVYAAFGSFMTVLASVPYAFSLMVSFNDMAEDFRRHTVRVVPPAEGQCLYVDPSRELKIVYSEWQRPLPVEMAAMFLPFVENSEGGGINSYEIGRRPIIEKAYCDALRPELVISAEDAAILKQDAWRVLASGDSFKRAKRDHALRHGHFETEIILR